ncbi:hypothetical protein E2F47_24980, partial [Mycobacterium eburneum]
MVPKPADMIGAEIVAGLWPEDAGIASIDAAAEHYRSRVPARQARADVVRQAQLTIRSALRSTHDDLMDERLTTIVKNRDALTENAQNIAGQSQLMADRGRELQQELLDIVDEWRTAIEVLCQQGQYQLAHIALYGEARGAATSAVAAGIADVQALSAQMEANHRPVTPMNWGVTPPPPASPASNGTSNNGSHGPTVQPVDNTTGSDEGGGHQPGRIGSDHDQTPAGDPSEQEGAGNDQGSGGDGTGSGRRSGNANQPGDDSAQGQSAPPASGSGRPSGTAAQRNGPVPTPPVPSASGGMPSSGGGGVPSSGLGGGLGQLPTSGLAGSGLPSSGVAGQFQPVSYTHL